MSDTEEKEVIPKGKRTREDDELKRKNQAATTTHKKKRTAEGSVQPEQASPPNLDTDVGATDSDVEVIQPGPVTELAEIKGILKKLTERVLTMDGRIIMLEEQLRVDHAFARWGQSEAASQAEEANEAAGQASAKLETAVARVASCMFNMSAELDRTAHDLS